MTEELRARLYQKVLHMVIWGEEKSAVMQKLEVNGIVGDEAEQMYGMARKDRWQAPQA